MTPPHMRLFVLCAAFILPFFCLAQDVETESDTGAESREKRSIFPWVVGETILDIQCKRGSLTVCAPDGPDACPVGYSSQTNVGVCGFATLNHFLNTTNIAGTCCYKTPGSSTSLTGSTTTTARSVLLPQIVAYPVYAQYPYSISQTNSQATATTAGYGSSSGSASSYSSPAASSSSYGSSPSSSSSYGSPAASSSSYGSSPSSSSSYGSPSSSSSSSPAAYARQYSSGSPSSSGYSSSSSSGYSSGSSASSPSAAAQQVYNPQNLAYPPLLSLTNIPMPNGSLFNPFPPAYNVAVYGSSTALINALQTLLAQLLGTSGASSGTISALQNALVLAMNTPGWTTQLTTVVQAATAAAAGTTGLNAATSQTIAAINALAATGSGNTVGNTVVTGTTGTSGTSSSSSTSSCGSISIQMPSMSAQFVMYLNAIKSQGISSPGLESFIESFQLAPVLNANAVATLTPLLATVASQTGSLSSLIGQSTANLQAALAAFTTYNSNGNTVALLQTLYQLSSTNPNLDPNVFGGLGALVAQTAGLSSVPVNSPPTLNTAVREATRYVAQSYQTPLAQVILARIINCRVTPSCCAGVTSGSGTSATTAASASYGSSYSGYSAPSASSMTSSYGSSPASSYSAPAASSSMTGSYGSSPASSSYAASPASSSSASYGTPASSSSSGYGSPASSSSSGYGSPSSSSSGYGSSSQASTSASSGGVAVNQSLPVSSAQNYTANVYPPFLPIYPVLQPASSSSSSGSYGSSSTLSGGVSLTLPASNQSAYNYGYPTGLPQYPVLPYYVQPASVSAPASMTSGSYASSPSSSTYGASATAPAGVYGLTPAASPASYGSASASPASYSAPAVAATTMAYGSASGYGSPAAAATPAAYGGSSGYSAPAVVATTAAAMSYGGSSGSSPAAGSPAPAAPAYGAASSYSAPATMAPATTGAAAYGSVGGGYGAPAPAPATTTAASYAPAAVATSGYSSGSAYGNPAPATAIMAPATTAGYVSGSAYGSGGYAAGPAPAPPATAGPATPAPATPGPATPAPATAASTTAAVSSTMGSRAAVSTWGPFPIAADATVQMKALDQCGVPHASQQGDIAFLVANGQKGPRANIYRSKRAASSSREARITNSMVAKEMEVCWMAAILLDGKYQSGASIVSEWFVLTAAHEIDGREISRLRIRVGDTDVRQGSLDKDERVGCIQDLLVDKIILHPDFDRKTLSSDIGLIKLKEPINMNSPCVCKICLQEEGPQEGETCIISGYGSTRVVDPSKTKTEEDAFALSGPNAEILRYAGIPVVANDVCAAAFKNERLAPRLKVPFGVLDDTQVCAGGISQRDACYGDGGSPLVCFNGRSFYQSGVVSYGRGCGKALMAAVYGSVTAAAPWISEALATQGN